MQYIRVLTFCIAICLLLASINAKAGKTITFSTHVSVDSNSFAFMQKIMTEAFGRLGMKFDIQSYPGKRSLEMANSGLTDGEASRVAGLEKEYPNLIQIPVVLRTIESAAYSQQNLELPNGWEDLKGLKIVIIRGAFFVTNMTDQCCEQVETVNTHIQQLRFLTLKRADVLIATPRLIEPLLKLDEFKNQGIHKITPALSAIKVYPYLHKKHKDLVAPFTQVLQEIQSDGTYDMIIK